MSNVYFGAYGSPANGNWNVASNWYSSLGDSQDSPIHLGRVPNISTDNAVIVNGTVTTPPASGTWDITVEGWSTPDAINYYGSVSCGIWGNLVLSSGGTINNLSANTLLIGRYNPAGGSWMTIGSNVIITGGITTDRFSDGSSLSAGAAVIGGNYPSSIPLSRASGSWRTNATIPAVLTGNVPVSGVPDILLNQML
jgi:hypothetical protein